MNKENSNDSLANGKVLQYLVRRAQDKEPQHFLQALNCLRDSMIVLPINVRVTDADAELLTTVTPGDTFSFADGLRFSPDILQNGDNFFLPVFSNADQMGDYGKNFSTIQMEFLEAISIAEARKDLWGIVLDPFTVPMLISKELFELAKNLPSKRPPEESK